MLAFAIAGPAAGQASQSAGSGAEQSSSVLMRVRPLARQGDPNAQYNMGVIYDRGYDVERDYDKAHKWYEKAADQGIAKAAHNLGVMYHEGHGVQVNEKRAVYWFRKAAKLGFPPAQNNLAIMYANSTGVERNLPQAVTWMARAAAAGNVSATQNLPVLSAELPQAVVEGDSVNVRARPTTRADVLVQVDSQARPTVLQQVDGWSRVLLDKDFVIGWIASSLLSVQPPVATVPKLAGEGSIDTDAVGEAPTGTAVETDAAETGPASGEVADDVVVLESATEGQAQSSQPDSEVATAGIAGIDQATKKKVGVDTANVRKRPSRRAAVLFKLHRGDTVSIINNRDGWAFVEAGNGNRGWVADYLLIGG